MKLAKIMAQWAAIRQEGAGQTWLCKDNKRLRPHEMTTSHKINAIRLYTRKAMRATGLPYGICVALIITKFPLLFEMACQVAEAGDDPFKDQGGVIPDDEATTDYPLADIFPLPGETKQ